MNFFETMGCLISQRKKYQQISSFNVHSMQTNRSLLQRDIYQKRKKDKSVKHRASFISLSDPKMKYSFTCQLLNLSVNLVAYIPFLSTWAK